MGYEQVWLSYKQLFNLFFFLFLCQVTCLHTQLCTQEQNSALLQLKRSFSLNKSASSYCDEDAITSFPKMESWKKDSDCCTWDGVRCDREKGEVIGLDLSCSWLKGTIHPNSSLFHSFPHLQELNLAYNGFAMSLISPEFTQLTQLTHLNLSGCNFSGKVPLGISFLNKLVSLDLSENYDLRLEEGGFKLLIQNISKIRDLRLRYVNMSSSVVPISLLNLTSLRILILDDSELHGEFPSGIFNLPHLQELSIIDNDGLTGYLPNFMNLSYPLRLLDLSYCKFHGSIPNSFLNLTQIMFLDLSFNNFSGILPSPISSLSNLAVLYLHGNKFTGPFFSLDANLPELRILEVANNCLTGPLPSQIIVPPNLAVLDIGRNLIDGTIPSWVFKLPAIRYLDLSYNKLTGHTREFQSSSLHVIDLTNNNLLGVVPNSTFALPSLTRLSLSFNNFSGSIPESNRFSENLTVLELRMNNFSGNIHDSFTMKNSLKTINLHGNGFEGPIPKSLVNCRNLEVLDFGRNKFIGKFPHWFGTLPNLQVLILQSNKFHGSILTPKTKFPFPMLRVLDISNNHFTGPLPIMYFRSLKAMMNIDEVHFYLDYMGTSGEDGIYYDSLTIVMKGSTIEMERILTIFTAIDFSKNNFVGEIPEIIGWLNSIRGLNLSHNSLTGHIPKSLGNLTKLEWLDLSSNKLNGEIPRQLTNLIFLETLNLSQNRLTGPIPRGKQFDTFQMILTPTNWHYVDLHCQINTCGDPNATQPPPSTFAKAEDSESGSGFCWEVILPGYGFGLVVGLIIGYLMFSFRKPEWLVKMVEGVGNRNGKKLKNNARRHGGRRN